MSKFQNQNKILGGLVFPQPSYYGENVSLLYKLLKAFLHIRGTWQIFLNTNMIVSDLSNHPRAGCCTMLSIIPSAPSSALGLVY